MILIFGVFFFLSNKNWSTDTRTILGSRRRARPRRTKFGVPSRYDVCSGSSGSTTSVFWEQLTHRGVCLKEQLAVGEDVEAPYL